ncbi:MULTISPECIES: TRAP transporter large permease [Hyphomicrobium]|jgi:TRAP-type mannitol/chloroaromatic compound transport system permease large subunit|uniref:TRAP transporter large permease n=1 Tax=Hyphomicrobium TaxID=81 RepID=UPI00036284FF|nr:MULTISPECIES: TRAP transporter large permease subunit [Hyphomicrobium]WBT38144.1 TRAP transporter large permease subunit [Hyphomicrobium sp. DMF-1]HML43379.1 TRAP transporter large permease subunit [Hyphomicrobium zavarzinii]
MTAFLAQNLAPIMFASLVIFLLLGYPVAFSLGAVGLVFFVVGVELAPHSDGVITLSWHLLQSMPGRIFDVMRNDTLLAIPFFTFMGLILERSGMAEDLLETVGQLFGTLRGGLAYAVIFVGALLAATTGVVAASVISMGLISLPIMLRYGYDRRLASGVIAASGTLAQIIPPSLVLIVLADQLGRSVDDMYKAAILPGLTLAGLYAAYVFIVSIIRPDAAPGLPAEEVGHREADGSRGLTSLSILTILSGLFAAWMMHGSSYSGIDRGILAMAWGIMFALGAALLNRGLMIVTGRGLLSAIAERVTFVMVPPLLLIFLVLGTILVGIATPTEGGAMGAVGALILAAAKRYSDSDARRFNFQIVRQAAEATAKLAAFVMFILIGARIFSLTFYGVNGHIWVEHLLTSLPGGMYGFLIAVMILIFLLAFFLDFFELCFILVPLLKPAAEAIFRTSPEAIAIAKSFGFAVLTRTDSAGVVTEMVADVTPFVVWFGVLLAVNMQTSFMHPPFGFALFYLRSVAPRETYQDKVTGRLMPPVTTSDIYWGAVPFVCIQLVMVGLIMAMPSLVMPKPGAHKAPPPTSISRPLSTAPVGDRGFALPGAPPAIEGAPDVPWSGPGAPSLDMRELPSFTAPERTLPRTAPAP